jgi:hypothetical protein
MNKARIARSFTVSLTIVGSIFIIPLIRCASTSSGSPTSRTFRTPVADCAGAGDRKNPIVCIDSQGNPFSGQKRTFSNGRNTTNAVPIVFIGPVGSVLKVGASGPCQNVAFSPICGDSVGNICTAVTVTEMTGTCTYTASVNNVTGTDPTIETDNCCATMPYEPVVKRPHQ